MNDPALLEAEEPERQIDSLADLLIDAVESGASVGFMPPMTRERALDYWRSVVPAIKEESRVLVAVSDAQGICGSVQIAFEMRENGNHRGELMKLFVHRRARRRGLAKALLATAESIARKHGRTLLLMDTRQGSEADKLCDSLGYTRLGGVPNYARSSDGKLHTTVFYYREL